MSILADLVASRRARARVMTNPDQFDARGEPWRLPPEEQTASTPSRKIRRAAPQPAKERPVFIEPKHSVPLSETALKGYRQREILKIALTAGTGKPSRTLKTPATPEDRERFLRINTHGHFSDTPFKETRDNLAKSAAQTRADFDAFIAAERARMAEARAKAKRDAKGRVADRNLWEISQK